MLFDLRSRGRRRVVQFVYLGLALLIGGGLVLFGVGTGSGGGLLNGLTGSGSSQQTQIVSSQEKTALAAVKADPSSAAAWAGLISARYTNAGTVGFNSTTETYNAEGKKELTAVGADWQHYLTLTKSPSVTTAIFAARADEALSKYSAAAGAWQVEIAGSPNLKGYECLAVTALAAGDTRVGGLAEAQALSLEPKADRAELKTEIDGAKTTPTVAQSC
jgi:hypothetical protein